ncbi:hypothetical protein M569_07907 [Genlisea aurea]|uniref:DUF868 domain-containing protein n=1 Tax=Genlisea aurea TaxID=192259 RepID=S8E3Q5_9LAMI|nr:hypothetical protein M569_07907 [Genlisea aurea]
MRDFPSCFGENGVQVADASCSSVFLSSKPSQNSVSCVYKCKLLGKSCLITITWSKSLMGQCLSVEIEDASHHHSIFRVDVKPSLFYRRKGSKSLETNSRRIQVSWDLSLAKFGSGPEPSEGYYIAVVSKGEMILLVGDLRREAFKKTGAVALLSSAPFISKREHVSGKGVYHTRAQFHDSGHVHDLRIECDAAAAAADDPVLLIRIDAKTVVQIRHLQWKFRGNAAFRVDGLPVQVYYDVHNWLFGHCLGNAVFLFHTNIPAEKTTWSCSNQQQPVDDSSWSCSGSFREAKVSSSSSSSGLDFSLILYASKSE